MKKGIIFAFLVASIFLLGCTPTKTPQNTGTLTGTQGLVMGFFPNAPPDKVFSGSDIKVAVKLENQGGTDITAGNIYVSGYDRTIVDLKGPTGTNVDGINLGGKNINNPVGGIEIKEFGSKVNVAPSVDKIQQTFLVTACYDYKTNANSVVCMDFNPFSTETNEKACIPKDVSLSGGQAAPVAVTKIAVMPAPDVTRFSIDIENVGNGIVYKQGSQNCNPYGGGLTFNELDFVRVDSVVISQEDLVETKNCQPLKEGFVRLTNKKATIFCSKFIGAGEKQNDKPIPAFNAPIRITLSYGYRNSVSKTIDVMRPPT